MKQHALNRPWWLLPPGRRNPLWWWAMAAALVAADYLVTGTIRFPVAYVVPVAFAAWYSGRRPARAIAAVVPIAHLVLFVTVLHASSTAVVVETILRAVVIGVLGMWFARLAEHERALERYVGRLEGLLPICAFCKSIRNKAGSWEPLESYIEAHSRAEFSHGFCPACADRNYPQLRKRRAAATTD